MARARFQGQIAGVGTTSGLRAVVGRWEHSPLGAFADVMVETASGHRVLLAPRPEVADFVAATYTFDEVRIEPVDVDVASGTGRDGLPAGRLRWEVSTPSLQLSCGVGRRTALGVAVSLVPDRVATAPAWTRVTDPVARLLVRGVRTRGSAGGGRREFYGATDVRGIDSAAGRFDGDRLGSLAPLDPPCRFGFSSAPRRPVLTSLVTTVEVPDPR
ncbi:hypothetical protein [Nocardioides solisilvae]|uniref:hypothetical protein n=1 Tax=Nocardioides solisilvae TaxID=1542435 RepID=UPI000D740155|nr:hypothetical protein [Nocardioides solisilvae]